MFYLLDLFHTIFIYKAHHANNLILYLIIIAIIMLK